MLKSAKSLAGGATGACVIIREGKNTKDVCEVMTEAECRFIDTELIARGAGTARFLAGQKCR